MASIAYMPWRIPIMTPLIRLILGMTRYALTAIKANSSKNSSLPVPCKMLITMAPLTPMTANTS